MLALWIILGIVALLGLLLLLPLQIVLRYDPENGFFYRVRLLFVPLVRSDRPEKVDRPEKKPAAPKKEQPEEQKKSAVSDLLAFLGLGEINTKARAKAAISERGLTAVLGDVLAAIKTLLVRTGKCLGSGVFQRFFLTVTIGGDDAADAAISYGTACAAVYSLVTLLEQSMTVRRRRVAVTIDDAQESGSVSLDLALRYRVWHLLRYACFLLGNYLKKERKPS